jgi:hypothetical protein
LFTALRNQMIDSPRFSAAAHLAAGSQPHHHRTWILEGAMEETLYHFENLHAAGPTPDGQHVVLQVTGAAGIVGLSLPAEHMARAVGMLLEATAAARAISGSDTIQAVEIKKLGVLQPPGGSAVLAVTVHEDAPPIAFRLSRQQLVDFARGILETEGVLPGAPPGLRQ